MGLPNFSGIVAVVSGGASGIGLAAARALRAEGAHVVLADRNEEGLAEAQRQLQQDARTTQVLAVPTDVRDEAQVQALMQRAYEIGERIDLVITSAGLGHGGPIDTFSGQEMQTMIDVNFMGTYHCVRAALPAMRKQKSGHFIFLSSVAGKLCTPLLSGYCASKWAVRGFSSALRAELYGTGIGITTVYPAWVDTPMLRRETDTLQSLHVDVLLKPEQVAAEMLQAAREDRTDVTLAPNHDIAFALKLMEEDSDKAEQLIGQGHQRRIQQSLEHSEQIDT